MEVEEGENLVEEVEIKQPDADILKREDRLNLKGG